MADTHRALGDLAAQARFALRWAIHVVASAVLARRAREREIKRAGLEQRRVGYGAAERDERGIRRVLEQGRDGPADGYRRCLRAPTRSRWQRQRAARRLRDVVARLRPRHEDAARLEHAIRLQGRRDADAVLLAHRANGRQARAGRERAVGDGVDDEVGQLLVAKRRGRVHGSDRDRDAALSIPRPSTSSKL